MMRHAFLLVFLCTIGCGIGRPEKDPAEARQEIEKDRFKKSDVGASGSGIEEEVSPLPEEGRMPPEREATPRKGILREFRHGQSLLLPIGVFGTTSPGINTMRDPGKKPITNFYEYLNNRDGGGESSVTSPTLHLNKHEAVGGEWTKTEVFPAEAIIVSTYNKDGTLKSSTARYRPIFSTGASNLQESGNFPRLPINMQRINWPFAGYFPVVINDPFLAAYNGLTSGMFNIWSTMIEYGPEADICRGNERPRIDESKGLGEVKLEAEVKLVKPTKEADGERAVSAEEMPGKRSRRDVTGIEIKFKNGERVNVNVQEPERTSNAFLPAEPEERTRAHSVMLVNPPPLSSIPRPTHTGFNIRKKAKPQKPDKENNSEEVGEEQEEMNTQGGPADGVAISPPPDGASVAEAKPVGLAIAGPGGVAAAKPQGTAVAGPGGLAIARPIGTAIAGVEVEGTVPIGGQQQKNKNKKKPKQDPEKMDDEPDSELHYVGGLTGPIGNPQPNTKDFGKTAAKSRNRDNLIFQGNENDGYQLKLGEQGGKYGFFPVMVSPGRGRGERIQKRMDAPTFFHGLLGSKAAEPQGAQTKVITKTFY